MLGNKDRKSDMDFSLRFNGNKLRFALSLSLSQFFFFSYFHHNLNDVLNVEVRSGPAVSLPKRFFQDVRHFKAIMENK